MAHLATKRFNYWNQLAVLVGFVGVGLVIGGAIASILPFFVIMNPGSTSGNTAAKLLDSLLKPENKDKLIDILQYHVFVGVLNAENFSDGQTFGQVNDGKIKITMVDGKPVINGKAHILASIKASNGMIHVIDEVLLPPAQ